MNVEDGRWQAVTLTDQADEDGPSVELFVRLTSEGVEVGIYRPGMKENDEHNQGIWLLTFLELFNGELRTILFENADYEGTEPCVLMEVGND